MKRHRNFGQLVIGLLGCLLAPLVQAAPLAYTGGATATGTLASGQWAYFEVIIPTNNAGWRITLNVSGPADADLYLARGSNPPNTSSSLQASIGQATDTIILTETETTPDGSPTNYVIGVYLPDGSDGPVDFTLVSEARYLTTLGWDPGTTASGSVVFTNQSATGGNYYFKITAQNTAVGAWRTALKVVEGEADAYLLQGSLPTVYSHNFKSERIGSDGFVLNSSQYTPGQDWYLLIRATAGAQWRLVSGEAFAWNLGSLAANGSSSTNVICGPEGMAYFKTTVPADTLAWRLWLNGGMNQIRVRKSAMPHPDSHQYGEPLPQNGQMLVVPDFLAAGTFNGTYFVGILAEPGEAIQLDSRKLAVADINFGSTNAVVAVADAGYRAYRVQVPVEQIAWEIKLLPASGNPNFAVRRDTVPNEFNNDAFSEAAGSTVDSLTLSPPTLSDGVFYITVYGDAPYSFTLANGNPVVTDVPFFGGNTNGELNRVGWRFYRVTDIASQLGSLGWDLLLQYQPEGTEIALRRNAVPSRWNFRQDNSDYVYSSSELDYTSSTGELQRPGHQADIWYIGIYNPEAPLDDFTLIRRELIPQAIPFEGSVSRTNVPVGQWQFFRMDVPANALGWDLRLVDVMGGRPQVMVRRDQLPEDGNNTFGPWSWAGMEPWRATNWPSGEQWAAQQDWTGWSLSAEGVAETGRILAAGLGNPLEPGTYYIGVINDGYSGGEYLEPMSYTLVSRGIGAGRSLPVVDLAYAGGSVSGSGLGAREAAYYRVQIASNTPSWRLRLRATAGETLLVMQKDVLPNVEAGRTYGGRFHDALSFHGGNRQQKAGDEYCVVLPPEGQSYLEAGTYYLAVVGEGVDPQANLDRIGSGQSAYVLESLGPLPVVDLGMATTAGTLISNSLAGGAVAAYQFTIPTNAPNVEVRLEDRVGHPTMVLRPGAHLPMVSEAWVDSYGSDGGYESGRLKDAFLITLANPSNGVYSLIIPTGYDSVDHSYPDASYTLRVRVVPPAAVAFDGGMASVTNQPGGNWRVFQVDVPANALGWDLRLVDVTGGQPRVVVRRDQLPDSLNNTFGPWSWNGMEPWRATNWPSGEQWAAQQDWTGWSLSVEGVAEAGRILAAGLGNPLEPGTYYIGVINDGYPGTQHLEPMSYTLVSRGIGAGRSLPVVDLAYAGDSVSGSGLGAREAAYYRVQIASNTPSWRLRLRGTAGETLLVLQKDLLPNMEAGRTYGVWFHDALSFHGGNRQQKAGDEYCVVLPPEGQSYLEAGTYYLAVVGEGVDPQTNLDRIGSGQSDYVVESLGPLPVVDLGMVTTAGTLISNSLAGGAVAAYQFTIPTNAPNVEVRLEDRVGHPALVLRQGAHLPMVSEAWVDGYGSDGGYESGRLADASLLTLANPSNGVYSLIVQAGHAYGDTSYPDASYTLRVRVVPPAVVAFDGGTASVTNQPGGNWRVFQVDVPANALGWDLRLVDVTGGQPRVVVRRDQLPNALNNTFGSWSWVGPEPWRGTNWPSGGQWAVDRDWTGWSLSAEGVVETGRILAAGLGNPLEPGTYYIGVINDGYPGTQHLEPMSYTLVSRGIGAGRSLPVVDLAYAGDSVSGSGLGAREAAYYRVQIASNTPSWRLRLRVTSGEALLALQKDVLPNMEAGRNQTIHLHDALGFHGGNRQQKAGDEYCVVLPPEGQSYLEAGTYYLAVVGEGVDPQMNLDRIGSGQSDYVLESLGPLPVVDLGMVTTAGTLISNSLAGGAVAAYQFTIPTNAPNVEVRLEDRVGHPVLALRGGVDLPKPPPGGWPDYAPYGSDGGSEAGRQTDNNVLTLANPSSGVYSLIVQAAQAPDNRGHPDATYTLRVRQPDILQLNLSGSQNTNGLTNAVSGVLGDNQRAYYRVEIPAATNGAAIVGWQLHLFLTQGSASLRVRKDLLPVDDYYSGTSPYASPVACIVGPYLTPGTWYVEVRGLGATDYTLTSSRLETERNWVMPESGQASTTPGLSGLNFGDSGTDANGNPILDPQTGTVTDQGIDLEQGRFDYYAITVPTNNSGVLRTVLEAISGNPDLYLRAGNPATLSHGPTPSIPWSAVTIFDRSQTGSTTEYGNWVPLDGRYETRLAPGTWYLAVHAAGNSNARYRLHLFNGDIQNLALTGGGFSGQSLLGSDWCYYRVQIPSNAPANWNLTFSQQSGDVVMYLRDTVPPGLGENSGDRRDWASDNKNSGSHPSYDAAGTYTLNVPSLRPGHTYYLGFRAVSDAVFSVSSDTSGSAFGGFSDIAFFGGTVTQVLPAHGQALYRINVPADAVRWRSFATNTEDVQLYLEQGTLPRVGEGGNHFSSTVANVALNQSLLLPNNWPWVPNQAYYLLVTNRSAAAQSFAFRMDGRTALTEDEDNDRLPDGWERNYFGSIYNYYESSDPDQDGLSNTQELLLGSNPMDSNTRGYLAPLALTAGGGLRLVIIGEVGRVYRVQVSSNFTSWLTITNITTGAGPTEILDAAAAGQARRYYRLVSP